MSQNEDLKKIADGVVGFCDEMRTYLENTKESFDRVLNTNYHVNTAPIITKTLEQEIADIIKEYPDYKESSVIAYRTFLHNGDTINVTSHSNNGEWFINGERCTADYTYTGENTELVNVIVFETGIYTKNIPAYQPVLGDTPTYFPCEIIVRNLDKTPEVSRNYYAYAIKITTVKFQLTGNPNACRVIIANEVSDFNAKTSYGIEEIYSDCDTYCSGVLKDRESLKKVSFPKCTEISSNYAFMGCTNIVEWEWGKLKKITGTTSNSTALFGNVHTVVIPDTVEQIVNIIAHGNTIIRLECNNARSIQPNWCRTAPTYFYIADNWRATVNLAVAGLAWNPEQFMDFAENKLSPLNPNGGTSEAREVTIPLSKASQLETLGFYDVCTAKGWSVNEA